jgi:hypothetical protein
MRSLGRPICATILGLAFAAAAAADTLELKDGRVLQGRYLGGTQAVLRFEINGEVKTFPVSDAVAVTFTGGASASAYSSASPAPAAVNPPPAAVPPAAAGPDSSQRPVTSTDVMAPPAAAPTSRPAAAPQQQPAPDPAAQYGMITIPAGQTLLVRMIDGVDSATNRVGDVFHASLETDLYVNGTFVAKKGTDVYGRLANAQEAGHLSGSAELQLELTRIVIDGRDYPLLSSDYTMKGQGRGSDTAKKVGGGAIFGAIIGAIAGGGKGAAIGAGAGSAAGAGVQIFTRGKQVKVPSETLLEFRLQQPATVTPQQG